MSHRDAAAPQAPVDEVYVRRARIQKLRWMGLAEEADRLAQECGCPGEADFVHRLPDPTPEGVD